MKANVTLFIIVALIILPSVNASEAWHSTKINTYISQGYTQTSDNNFYGNSQQGYGSFSLRELGINASTNLSKSLFSSVQVITRRTGQEDDEDLSLDYALIDYTIPLAGERSYGIRLGRIKNPLGFYNETRDVPFTRPSVILPQSIYFDRTRDLALSADGIHLYSDTHQENYSSGVTFGILKPRIENKYTTTTLLGPAGTGSLESEISYVWKLEVNTNPYILSYSGAALKLTYDNTENVSSDSGSVKFLINILSFQYDREHLSITSEYADRRFHFNNLTDVVPYKKINGESYYVQITSLISSSLKYYLRYDVIYQDRHDKDGKKFAAITGGERPNHSRYAKDWTIGLRWDINRHLMLSLEHHWVNGTAWLPIQNNPNPNETKEEWRLITGVVSFKY